MCRSLYREYPATITGGQPLLCKAGTSPLMNKVPEDPREIDPNTNSPKDYVYVPDLVSMTFTISANLEGAGVGETYVVTNP